MSEPAPEKQKKKLWKKLLKAMGWGFAIVLALNLLGLILNKTFYARELEGIAPYGSLVEIDGKKMHVYAMGTEENTEEKAEEKTEGETGEKTGEKTEEKTEEKAEGETEANTEEKTEGETGEKTEEKTEENTEKKAEEKTEGETGEKTEENTEKKAEGETEANTEANTERKPGRKTIVLLAGFGIPLPSADFGPLMRALSKKYKVVVVEYFGVGFSEPTDTPRTNENYTQEIRKALSMAGFKPPYVLMPHSASGIYAEYYATKYPDEISAIVMLDTTATIEQQGPTSTNLLKFVKYLQNVGFVRLLSSIGISSSMNEKMGYTKEEIEHHTQFLNHSMNKTIFDQGARFYENILEVKEMAFPDKVPVLKMVASETLKQGGEEYLSKHLKRLGKKASSLTVEGSHFFHQTHVPEILEATTAFLNSLADDTP
ncbi:MAG: alpha/beta hydrolase [Cystobacterineae bacterium]|nr:alpha/beta hydrolase [Cystobacterineae bacterium]